MEAGRTNRGPTKIAAACGFALLAAACAGRHAVKTDFHDGNMDFSLIRTVAVLPFANMSSQNSAGERVRDVFITALQAEGTVYVLPPGEIARGLTRTTLANPASPSAEEVVAFAKIVGADALVTGSLLEYGEARSGTASANYISLSLKMVEAQTGKVVWSAVSTKGGVNTADRLFGGGGQPMNDVTLEAVADLINRLMR